MAELISSLKAASGGIGWLFKWVSKRFANPKLVLNVEKMLRTRAASDRANHPTHYDVPAYVYSIRVNNDSEHTAYGLKLVSCNPPILAEYLDYFTPVPSHSSQSFTLEFRDENVVRWDDLGDIVVLSVSEFVSTGPDSPPLSELRIEYTNSKGRKFFTVFTPNEAPESQNQHGTV